jgi:hypothetical protein
MQEQQYQWMLGLAAAWLQKARHDLDDDKPSGPRVERVVGIAGCLSGVPNESANDLTAAWLVLVVIWLWNCAKYRAIFDAFARSGAKSLQINAAPIFSTARPETRYPTGFRSIPVYPGSFSGLCQINCPLT